jgi:mortality factor 4-like protein 1
MSSSAPQEAAVPSSPMHIEQSGSDDSNDSSGFRAPPPFNLQQKVLCRDANNKEHFYESKIIKLKCLGENKYEFFVHYNGWNSRWDRWAPADDLVDDTEENRKVHLKPIEPQKKRKKDDSSRPPSSRKKKAFTEAFATKQIAAYEEYCHLPMTLKTVMVDEHEKIARKGFDAPYFYDCEPSPRPARSVHVLPALVTVEQVLQHYQRKRGGSNIEEKKQEQLRKFCQGLGLVFDDALPVCLLYPEERPQYESMMQDSAFKDKPPSQIYGCEFLLRLMVRLPTLLLAEPKSKMDIMGPLIEDLIVLLQKNRQACFKCKYREPKYCELRDWEKALADNDRSAKSKMDS